MPVGNRLLEGRIFAPDFFGITGCRERIVDIKQEQITRGRARKSALEELRLVFDVSDGVAEHHVNASAVRARRCVVELGVARQVVEVALDATDEDAGFVAERIDSMLERSREEWLTRV